MARLPSIANLAYLAIVKIPTVDLDINQRRLSAMSDFVKYVTNSIFVQVAANFLLKQEITSTGFGQIILTILWLLLAGFGVVLNFRITMWVQQKAGINYLIPTIHHPETLGTLRFTRDAILFITVMAALNIVNYYVADAITKFANSQASPNRGAVELHLPTSSCYQPTCQIAVS